MSLCIQSCLLLLKMLSDLKTQINHIPYTLYVLLHLNIFPIIPTNLNILMWKEWQSNYSYFSTMPSSSDINYRKWLKMMI